MDCKKLLMYGLIILVGLYLLKDICGFKIPYLEGMSNVGPPSATPTGTPGADGALPSDPDSFIEASLNKDIPACQKKDPLTPKDLLPVNQAASDFEQQNPDGEGILKGVNYLDATYHVGVNTVGQSLRNANLNLRAEPPNPRVAVSPWLNSTIDTDLIRKPLGDNLN
tara:strand:- start:2833 stop:3333 length:501 start_codon:yes stop_codon:yes gene_type:complete